LFVVWLYGRWQAIRHAWPLVLILGTIIGVGQLLVAKISPELSTFLAAGTTIWVMRTPSASTTNGVS
jgi:lactate permease